MILKINSDIIVIFVVVLTSLSLITALASIIYLSSAQVFAVTIEDQQNFVDKYDVKFS